MTLTVPFGHPTSLRAGDTWRWRISFADYPVSDSWVLSYALVSASSLTQAPLTWATSMVTNDGAEYTVTIPILTTATFGAGSYRLTAFVTLSGARYSPYSQPLLVAPNAATLTAGQGQTYAEKTWLALKDLIAGRVVADIDSYQINGRALNRIPFEQLPKWEAYFAEKVWRERNPGKTLPGLVTTFWPQR